MKLRLLVTRVEGRVEVKLEVFKTPYCSITLTTGLYDVIAVVLVAPTETLLLQHTVISASGLLHIPLKWVPTG